MNIIGYVSSFFWSQVIEQEENFVEEPENYLNKSVQYLASNTAAMGFVAVGIISAIAIPRIIKAAISYFKKPQVLHPDKIPIRICNIEKLPWTYVQQVTRGSNIKYIKEKDGKIGVRIDCSKYEKYEIPLVLAKLREFYPTLVTIEFVNFSAITDQITEELTKFENLVCLSFKDCILTNKGLKGCLSKLPAVKYLKLVGTTGLDTSHVEAFERKYVVKRNNGTSNLDELTQAFHRDLALLEANPSAGITQTFLQSLEQKPYLPIFSVPLDLDLKDVRCVSEPFCQSFMRWLREKNARVLSLEVNAHELTGGFLSKGFGLPVRRLVLGDLTRFRTANLSSLVLYPSLEHLEITRATLNELALSRLRNLTSLKSLILRRIIQTPDAVKNLIKYLLRNLDFVAIENTTIEGEEIEEILASNTFNTPFILCNNDSIYFSSCRNVVRETHEYIANSARIFRRLHFRGENRLFYDDLDTLVKSDRIQIEELDLNNVQILPQTREEYYTQRTLGAMGAGSRFARGVRGVLQRRAARPERNPLALIAKWPLTTLHIDGHLLRIDRAGGRIAITITREGGGERSFDRVFSFLEGFEKIDSINFSNYQPFDHSLRDKVAHLVEIIQVDRLDWRNVNLHDHDIEGDDDGPSEVMKMLFRKVKTIDLRGNDIQMGDLFTMWKEGEGTDHIRKGDIGNNDLVRILLHPTSGEEQELRIENIVV